MRISFVLAIKEFGFVYLCISLPISADISADGRILLRMAALEKL